MSDFVTKLQNYIAENGIDVR